MYCYQIVSPISAGSCSLLEGFSVLRRFGGRAGRNRCEASSNINRKVLNSGDRSVALERWPLRCPFSVNVTNFQGLRFLSIVTLEWDRPRGARVLLPWIARSPGFIACAKIRSDRMASCTYYSLFQVPETRNLHLADNTTTEFSSRSLTSDNGLSLSTPLTFYAVIERGGNSKGEYDLDIARTSGK